MKTSQEDFLSPTSVWAAIKPSNSFARGLAYSRLKKITQGCIRIHEQEQTYCFGEPIEQADLVVDVHIHHADFFTELVFGGSIGAGEAYMNGYWSTPNLTGVMQVLARNLSVLNSLDSQQSLLARFALKAFHWANTNNRKGSRKNIAAHYDLGNDFFRLFLDKTMMYSAAIYPQPSADLAEAAEYKLRCVCEKLQLKPEDHLLEIGAGWGGMAIYAAQHYGCKVTTTTISKEQFEMAQARVAAAGLSDKVSVLFEDYRDLKGRFSKLVSIEMIEAVGHENYGQYFECCAELLAPNGLMLLQAITINDQRYDQAKQSVDFIQRYIFPGGSLPSVTVMSEWVKRKTDMNIIHLEDIGEHYAQTLKHWRNGFLAQIEQVRAQGFDERFIRMWEFYLCYCEGGFRERSISTVQLLLAKPSYRAHFFSH